MSSSTHPPENDEHRIYRKQTAGLDDDADSSMDLEEVDVEVDFDQAETSSRKELAQQTPARDSRLSWLAPSFLLRPTAGSTATLGNALKIATVTTGDQQYQNSHDDEHLLRSSSPFCFSAAASASSSWDEYDKSAILTAAQQQHTHEDRGIHSAQQQKKRGTPHRGPTPKTCTKRRQRSSPFQQQQQQQPQEQQQQLFSTTAPRTVRKQSQKSKRTLTIHDGSCASRSKNNNLNDSVDTNDSNCSDSTMSQSNSNFRFTAFPASLPRIGAPRPTGAIVLATGHCLEPSAPSSFENVGDHNPEEDHDFIRDADDFFDDDESTPLGTPVAQTRLNFNEALLMGPLTQTSSRTKCQLQNFAIHGRANGYIETEYTDETGALVDSRAQFLECQQL